MAPSVECGANGGLRDKVLCNVWCDGKDSKGHTGIRRSAGG